MTDRTMMIDGVTVPRFLYGTAWKEDDTARLTEMALRQGFRGVDTANQRKHYFEAGAGEGIRRAIGDGVVARDGLFLQTKFTYRRGQDDRLPYDPDAPLADQVAQSFDSSLDHLGTDRIDSLVLHGLMKGGGVAPEDREVWGAMEALRDSGKVALLGVSNVGLDQLALLCREVRIPPRFVQNRCFAKRGWDGPIRAFCREHGIVYQGFSLLTANREVLSSPALARIAERHGRAPTQVIFRFALAVGMLPLTGTKDPAHMADDLAAFDFELAPEEVVAIEAMTGAGAR